MLGPRNESFGSFGRSQARGSTRAVLLRAGLLFAFLQLGGWQLTTQWLARRLDYQPALGAPWLQVGQTPLYLPWRHFMWRDRLRGTSDEEVAVAFVRQADSVAKLPTALAVLITMALWIRWRRRGSDHIDQLYGSAAFATRKDIARAGLFHPEGVVVGRYHDAKGSQVLHHDGPEGVLVFAPPRSGKGIGPVQSTLLSWKHSAIVLDPKGENHAFTSGWRQRIGQRIYRLNFAAEPIETAGFNPLDTIRIGTSREVADAQRLAKIILDPDGVQAQGSNAHWTETAFDLLTGAILHVLYRDRAHGASASLLDVSDELADIRRTHEQVLEQWLSFAHDPDLAQGWTLEGEQTATHPAVARAARIQLNREERERTSVLSSTIAKLTLFRDPCVATNTSHSSFALEDLMDADVPVTVYLVVPENDKDRLRPLVRIFLDCAMRRMMEEMRFADGDSKQTHKHRLLLMLDEFPSLGRMNVFTETFASCAGYGIKPYLIAQDYEQIRNAYGDRETLSSCCDLWLAYAPNKMETAQMLSARLGKVTVRVRARPSLWRKHEHSEREVARDLMNANDVMSLQPPKVAAGKIIEPGEMLLFMRGGLAVLGRQPLFFLDPVLRKRRDIPTAPASPTLWDAEDFYAVRAAARRRVAAHQASSPPVPIGGPGVNAAGDTPIEAAPVELHDFADFESTYDS